MAISIVKAPNDVTADQGFITFSFNGKHSYNDFGIIRTIDGERYNENIAPTLEEKTAEVPGGDGRYYFGTLHKQRNFNINIAFDGLTEAKFRQMKQWLNGKDLGDLWFSEAPYKVWTAKVIGTPVLKYIPFEENGVRIYKGEGTIQFTAYWPYAHTPDLVEGEVLSLKADEEFIFAEALKSGELYIESATNEVFESLKFFSSGTELTNRTVTGSVITFDNEKTITSIKAAQDMVIKIYIGNSKQEDKLWKWRASGKRAQAYNNFENQSEWIATSGLNNDTSLCDGENPGDVPTTFTLTYPASGFISTNATANKTFTVGNLSITIGEQDLQAGNQIIWDSKTGIVSKKSDESVTAISYTGTGCGTIPVNGLTSTQLNLQGGTLKYHYWYY